MKDAVETLKEHGLKVTSARIEILRYLNERMGDHMTADEIFLSLKKKHPSLSRTTVYNTLEQFRRLGIVQAISITEKELRYDPNTEPHHHFCCKVCGVIIEVEGEGPEKGEMLCDLHEVDEFQGYYKGTCHECLQRREGEKNGQI